MAEIITGDNTKSIKSVGELALRISRFDSYRLFTLYENVKERKLMDVSGNQKYYLVFKSPKKEIRIPEYDPKGFFKVDKVNGCILFKITKKNADDILSMKTAGDKTFYIIRTYEETDAYGRVLNVTDEVEVYNGRWGDDEAFSAFSTENKVDLLTKALAVQIDKNANQLKEYSDLLEKYNNEVMQTSNLEKEAEALRAERDSLQASLNEYLGSTYDGTILSTDTKYIAFENTLDNISFTEEQYNNAINELMTKNEIDLSNTDIDDPVLSLNVRVFDNNNKLKINVKKNDIDIGSAVYNQSFIKITDADDKDVFIFEGEVDGNKNLIVKYNHADERFKDAVKITQHPNNIIRAIINYTGISDPVGTIGSIDCYIQ